MRAALPDITHLQGGRVIELILRGKIPLIYCRGSHVRIPKADNCATKRIGRIRKDRQPLTRSGARQRRIEVRRIVLVVQRRIQRQRLDRR